MQFYFILVNLQVLGRAAIPAPEAPSPAGQSRAQPRSWLGAARADAGAVQDSLRFPGLRQPVASGSRQRGPGWACSGQAAGQILQPAAFLDELGKVRQPGCYYACSHSHRQLAW